jgi:hypothetical protein
MSKTIAVLTEIKNKLEPAVAKTFRSDQLERDANGAIKAPTNETKYFVIFFLVGSPENVQCKFQRDTIRLTAWATDSNAALALWEQAEPLLGQLVSFSLGRLTYDGYSSPYHGWTREIFIHE